MITYVGSEGCRYLRELDWDRQQPAWAKSIRPPKAIQVSLVEGFVLCIREALRLRRVQTQN